MGGSRDGPNLDRLIAETRSLASENAKFCDLNAKLRSVLTLSFERYYTNFHIKFLHIHHISNNVIFLLKFIKNITFKFFVYGPL